MVKIKLKEIDICNDLNVLYNWMLSDEQYLFSVKLSFNNMMLFEEWFRARLNNSFHDFFMVEYNDKLIGYVHNYDFSLINGNCKLVTYIDKEYRKWGIGGIATIYYLQYLFLQYPLRKVYSTIYSNNKESLNSNLQAGFVEEGCLKKYKYYDGKYYNLYYLSLDREQFEKLVEETVM